MVPLTYFRFSSSFICSARSKVGGRLAIVSADGAGRGVPLAEVWVEAPTILSGEATGLARSAVCVTTGETAMMPVGSFTQ